MSRTAAWFGLALLCFHASCLADEPSHIFELKLPGLFDRLFEGGLIEVPDRPIEQLQLYVLQTETLGITYGNIFVKINGKGAGSAFDRRPTSKGVLLNMDLGRLRLRPDQLIDPRENTVEAIAQDSRGHRYYQNWIIRAAERGRNEFFAYASSQSPSDPNGSPPDLILEEPNIPPVIGPLSKSIRVHLKGIVSGAEPGIAVTLNGRPWLKPAAAVTTNFDDTISVTADTKEITLEALDPKGNRRSLTVPVAIQTRAPVKVRFAGQRYAVVIGVSRFGEARDGSLPILPGAAAEARQFATELTSKAKIPAGNILVLVDEQATMPQIHTALSTFAAKAEPDDLLLVYVASYGLHDPLKPERLYLAPYGAQAKDLKSTAIDFEDLEVLINRNLRCNNSIFLFDVGHELPGVPARLGSNMINNYLLNIFSEQEGRAVLVSASTDQVGLRSGSGVADSGFFSQYVGKALEGAADANRDGVVTAAELFAFVTNKVREETKDAQIPRYRLASRVADRPVIQ